MKECVIQIFNSFPWINYFSFCGYTDYFNDGDECHFYMREYTLKVNDHPFHDDTDILEEDFSGCPSKEEIEKAKTLLTSLIHTDDEMWRNAFDDHFKVEFKRNGDVEVHEYRNHD